MRTTVSTGRTTLRQSRSAAARREDSCNSIFRPRRSRWSRSDRQTSAFEPSGDCRFRAPPDRFKTSPMFRPANVRAAIDSLHANVAILDSDGAITEVNEGWRRFGDQRRATSDCVGLNYVRVCLNAAEAGDRSAERVANGLLRILRGQAFSYGKVYQCADRTFRMTARPISQPGGGIIVAHQDITALMAAR